MKIVNKLIESIIALLFLIPFLCIGQASDYGLGLNYDDEGYQNIPMKTRDVGYQDATADLARVSLKAYAPKIKNQGNHGTCVGWATAYYAQTIIRAMEKDLTDQVQITESAYSPLFLYYNAKQNTDPYCKKGVGIPTALNKMLESGSVYYNDFSAQCATSVPDSVYKKAKRHRLKEFTKLFGLKEDFPVRISETRKALANGNPVVMGMEVSNAFQSASVVYEPDSINIGGHAMAIIGYDDEKFDGAFEVINSWGEDWGNEGYMWIRYKDFAESVRYGFELVFEELPEEDEKQTLAASLELTQFGYPLEVQKKETQGQGLGYQSTVYETAGAGVADYSTKKKFPVGTKYRIKTTIDQPAYIYVFGADTKRPVNRLFPDNDSISAFVNAKNAYVMIPGKIDENRIGRITLDTKDVESDYTIAIISLEKLDMQAIKDAVDTMEGPVIERFYEVLKDKLIQQQEMVLSDGVMGFNAEFDNGSAAIMALDIRRSDYQAPTDE